MRVTLTLFGNSDKSTVRDQYKTFKKTQKEGGSGQKEQRRGDRKLS